MKKKNYLNAEGDDDLVVPGGVGAGVGEVERGADHVHALHVLVAGAHLQPPLHHAHRVLLHEVVPGERQKHE